MKEENNFTEDTQLTAEHLKELVEQFKEVVRKETEKIFPMTQRNNC